jgi:hypothetical protein
MYFDDNNNENAYVYTLTTPEKELKLQWSSA